MSKYLNGLCLLAERHSQCRSAPVISVSVPSLVRSWRRGLELPGTTGHIGLQSRVGNLRMPNLAVKCATHSGTNAVV